jgi:hypothetical protein
MVGKRQSRSTPKRLSDPDHTGLISLLHWNPLCPLWQSLPVAIKQVEAIRAHGDLASIL